MREIFGRKSRECFLRWNRMVSAEPVTVAVAVSQSRLFISNHHLKRIRITLSGVNSDGCEAQSFDVRKSVPRRERSMQVPHAMFHSFVVMHDECDRRPSEAVRGGTVNTQCA